MERIQGGVEAKAKLEDVLYPGRPCLSGFFLMTSSWMGSWMDLPVRYFLHDLVMGRISIMAPGTFRNVGTPGRPHPEGAPRTSVLFRSPAVAQGLTAEAQKKDGGCIEQTESLSGTKG